MIEEIRDKLKSEYICVTDIPKEGGGYEFRNENAVAESDIRKAQMAVGANAGMSQQFWHMLGGLVAQNKVARCNGCTAYAARCLEGLANQNNKRLLICGIKESDHHVLLVTDNTQAASGAMISGQGNTSDIVVDLWQFNIDRQTSGAVNLEVLANTAANHYYTSGANIKVFTVF